MVLKNDYKDDVLDTSKNTVRKYNLIENADGTVSLVDATQYVQVGDTFGAQDVNAMVEVIQGETVVNVPAASWVASTAPYTWQQLVSVPGMTADMKTPIDPTYTGLTTAEQMDAYDEAYGLISLIADSRNGGLMLWCRGDKPAISIKIKIKGIGV